MTPTAIVAYLVLFATVGFLFLLASLILGRFLRAQTPTRLKLETYECGEPAIGPGFLQFDLRFYVVALVFIIFEVEVAMFFPPATVFGKATQLLQPDCSIVTETSSDADQPSLADPQFSPLVIDRYREFGVPAAAMPSLRGDELLDVSPGAIATRQIESQANTLALASMLDLGVFFAVLLVGFAFVWRQGDLDWVRAMRHPPTAAERLAGGLEP